jgi:hypothetical protein
MGSFLWDILGNLIDLLPWFRKRNDRRKEWAGTVEAKKTLTLSKHAYLVIFRTDDGQKKKVRLDRKEDFDSYEEGRRYTKGAGQDLPDTQPASDRVEVH